MMITESVCLMSTKVTASVMQLSACINIKCRRTGSSVTAGSTQNNCVVLTVLLRIYYFKNKQNALINQYNKINYKTCCISGTNFYMFWHLGSLSTTKVCRFSKYFKCYSPSLPS